MLQHYIRIFLSLIAIGAMLYLIYFALSIFPGRKTSSNKSKRLKIIEHIAIGPGVGLYLVGVDEKEFIMSFSNKTINSLQPLEAQSIKDFSKILTEKKVERKAKSTVSNTAASK